MNYEKLAAEMMSWSIPQITNFLNQCNEEDGKHILDKLLFEFKKRTWRAKE